MGARTNYTIVTTNNPDQNINVYSHWDGSDSVAILQHAIEKAMPRLKMNDISYAARIIIDQLIEGGRDSETGYGIYIGSSILAEEQYEYKEVNLIKNTVTIGQSTYNLDSWLSALV